MLCAGVVHGDLSEFNILLAADGPVIIDLPQAVDAAGNNHAARMLLRDVDNLRDFFGRFAPELLATEHGPEIWALYERGLLRVDSVLTGRYERDNRPADLQARDARDRRRARRRSGAPPAHDHAGVSTLPYLRGYAPELLARATQLITERKLRQSVLRRYPHSHDVRTDRALYDYVTALKTQHLRNAEPLARRWPTTTSCTSCTTRSARTPPCRACRAPGSRPSARSAWPACSGKRRPSS